MPIAMQWIDAHFPVGGGWEATSFGTELSARGVPWWLAAWLFPPMYVAAVGASLFALESLLFILRLDRGDHAWSSMKWTLQGWKVALAWTLMPVLGALAAAFVLAPTWGPMVLMFAPFFGYLLPLLLPFLVTNARYLGSVRPTFTSRPHWPGPVPVLLWLVPPVALPCLFFALPALPEPTWPLQLLLLAVLVPVAIFLQLIAQLAWLNRGVGAREASRRALRPRVFLPALVQALRWQAGLPMLFLVGLPGGILLIHLLPMLEAEMLLLGPLGLDSLIAASRFAVAWWWAVSLVAMTCFQLVLSWFGVVGFGRLLLELGQVDGTSPPGG